MDDTYIVDGLVELIFKAEIMLPSDVLFALRNAAKNETGIAKVQIENMLKNCEVAQKTGRPICQDTGVQTFFVRIGKDFPYAGELKQMIIKAVKVATDTIPLRPNTVDVFTRKNSCDNVSDFIPAINWDFTEGEDVHITSVPKGGGSENMSKLVMFKPSLGLRGIKEFIVEEMIKAGGNPCPPTDSGIGPMGLGGKTTVLDVHVEMAPRHPASLPVGLVVQCWADRRATMVIHRDGTYEVL